MSAQREALDRKGPAGFKPANKTVDMGLVFKSNFITHFSLKKLQLKLLLILPFNLIIIMLVYFVFKEKCSRQREVSAKICSSLLLHKFPSIQSCFTKLG